jgi:Carboxypeptidase regulatory-like domain
MALLLVSTAQLSAQETLTNASVTGRVIDPSGAVVARATITAIQVATNQSHIVQTDGQGHFRLAYLPVGEYQISVQAEGFAKVSRQV